MAKIIVNCADIAFGKALGVPSFLLNLCEELSKNHDLTFAVNDPVEVQKLSYRSSEFELPGLVETIETIRNSHLAHSKDALELLPHHFQEASICRKSILIYHDLHVFDLPWKYGNAERQQTKFKSCIQSATAVMAHFPRSYYDLERVAGIAIMNLFLTESPLLIDTQKISFNQENADSNKIKTLLYPGQLQAHKNHEGLIQAAALLKRRGIKLKLAFPGTVYSDSVSEQIHAIAKRRDVEDMCQFLGRVSDEELLDLYANCHGVIVPSLAEGGAYVALEAIAAGKPVAVNQIRSARMHLDAMKAEAIWFDAQDIHQTADAMADLLVADPQIWFMKNKETRTKIAQTTWALVADHWNRVINYIVHDGTRPTLRVDKTGGSLEYV